MSTAVAESSLAAAAKELERGIAALRLPLDGAQQDQLMRFVALLHKWNRVYNLTAVREVERMVSRFCQSVSASACAGWRVRRDEGRASRRGNRASPCRIQTAESCQA
jgi:hypothetical protein